MKILLITHSLDYKSGWGRYSHDLLEALRSNNNEVNVLNILPNPLLFKRLIFLTPWYIIRSIFYWNRIKDVDCIHCLIEPYAFFTLVLSQIFNKKYFITVHGSYAVKTLANNFLEPFQKLAYKKAKKIISISHFTERKLMEFTKLSNVVVIPNGGPSEVSLGSFSKTEDSLISVGALKWRKGHHKTIEAVALIKKEIPNINLTIVGNQSDKKYVDSLNNRILELGLMENIKILSNLSELELNEVYNKSKIFILLPLSGKLDFEGFGLVYLEANTHALPVIGALNSGAEEAINDGQSGFLVDPEDSKTTALYLKKLLVDDGLYVSMSNGALIWAASMTWKKQVIKYIELYKKNDN